MSNPRLGFWRVVSLVSAVTVASVVRLQAAEDVAFRHAQLEDLRTFKNLGAGLVGMCAVGGVVISVYGVFTGGEWDKGMALGFTEFLGASTFHTRSIHMAALQALDGRGA